MRVPCVRNPLFDASQEFGRDIVLEVDRGTGATAFFNKADLQEVSDMVL
jgi:hypothetical protein